MGGVVQVVVWAALWEVGGSQDSGLKVHDLSSEDSWFLNGSCIIISYNSNLYGKAEN